MMTKRSVLAIFDLYKITEANEALWKLRLFTNNIELTSDTVTDDLVQATYGGYAEIVGLAWVGAPDIDGAGNVIQRLTPKLFQRAGGVVNETCYGWSLHGKVSDEGEVTDLIIAEKFPVPVAFAADWDSVMVIPFVSIGLPTPGVHG